MDRILILCLCDATVGRSADATELLWFEVTIFSESIVFWPAGDRGCTGGNENTVVLHTYVEALVRVRGMGGRVSEAEEGDRYAKREREGSSSWQTQSRKT